MDGRFGGGDEGVSDSGGGVGMGGGGGVSLSTVANRSWQTTRGIPPPLKCSVNSGGPSTAHKRTNTLSGKCAHAQRDT